MNKVKKTNNVSNPDFIVDITNATTEFDIILAFAEAKNAAKIKLNKAEKEAIEIKNSVKYVKSVFDLMTSKNIIVLMVAQDLSAFVEDEYVEEHFEKKPNIFKRFWNWITRKNN